MNLRWDLKLRWFRQHDNFSNGGVPNQGGRTTTAHFIRRKTYQPITGSDHAQIGNGFVFQVYDWSRKGGVLTEFRAIPTQPVMLMANLFCAVVRKSAEKEEVRVVLVARVDCGARWDSMKAEDLISDCHDLQTMVNLIRDLVGSFNRIL